MCIKPGACVLLPMIQVVELDNRYIQSNFTHACFYKMIPEGPWWWHSGAVGSANANHSGNRRSRVQHIGGRGEGRVFPCKVLFWWVLWYQPTAKYSTEWATWDHTVFIVFGLLASQAATQTTMLSVLSWRCCERASVRIARMHKSVMKLKPCRLRKYQQRGER